MSTTTTTPAEKVEQFVRVPDYMAVMLECISSEEYKDAVATASPEYRAGAQWGIAYAAIYANVYCKKYLMMEEED